MNRLKLRQETLQRRDLLPPEDQAAKSTVIQNQLTCHSSIVNARHVFIYVHFRSEVQTLPMIKKLLESGKTVSVPVTLSKQSKIIAVALTDPGNQLTPGYYGILEPTPETIASATVAPATIDTVIVPGSVFDNLGGRLGYGGGFYDRFLSLDAPQAQRVALAYELQMTAQVPVEPHDQCMDHVITEQLVYDCQRRCHA